MDDFEDLEVEKSYSHETGGNQEGEDGEEWGGVKEETGRKPAKGKVSHGPPTGEELRDIRDATDLYRSGSFKLQVRF
jgi:U3 small nucleolar RNA-associated protein 22